VRGNNLTAHGQARVGGEGGAEGQCAAGAPAGTGAGGGGWPEGQTAESAALGAEVLPQRTIRETAWRLSYGALIAHHMRGRAAQ
jgi:hypothetical protein